MEQPMDWNTEYDVESKQELFLSFSSNLQPGDQSAQGSKVGNKKYVHIVRKFEMQCPKSIEQ